MSQQAAPAAERPTRPAAPELRRRPRRPLPFLAEFYRSPVGKKWVMALTGIALLGYVLVHMLGNLHMYEGPRQMNEYGEALRDLGGDLVPRSFLLWVLRVGLAAAFLLHIHAAYSLTLLNRKARPQRYASKRDYLAANFASRTMRWTGTIVLLYLLFHLADLTWGWLNPDFIRGDPYNNVVQSLSNPGVAAIYLIANIALAFHIFHGAWSMFQSMGVNNPRTNAWRRSFAMGFAAIILIGNASFPIAVQAGLVSEENRCWPSEASIQEALHQGATMGQIEAEVTRLSEQGICVFQLEREQGTAPGEPVQVPSGVPEPGPAPGPAPEVPIDEIPEIQIEELEVQPGGDVSPEEADQ